MHVIAHRPQIPVAASIHHQGLVAATKDMTKELVPVIEPDGVSAQKPAHPGHQIGIGRFHHQMEMIPHQAVGMHLETGLQARLSQRFQKVLAVHVIQKDVAFAVTPTHDVVDRTRIFDSEFARHQRLMCPNLQRNVKRNMCKVMV